MEKTGQEVPRVLRQAEKLTRFAVFTRYPGIGPPIKQKEYEESVKLAAEVVRWAEKQLKRKKG